MLESCLSQELCRNGSPYGGSPIQQQKVSRARATNSVIGFEALARKRVEGVLMQMAELAQRNQNQIIDHEIIDRELRVRTDTETWLAETLHGSMQTEFEFGFDGEVIRGEDGGSLDEIFDDSIAVAREMTQHSPNMLFELRRRLTERGELNDMYGMVTGELPNTMIAVSDFPEELKNQKEDVGGYNVDRQQTMLRIITAKEGKINIITRSLDGSNRQALEAIYGAMGEPVEEGEMLGQRIHRDLDETWQDKLPTILTEAHDDSLQEQTGDEYYAGIKQSPDINMVDTYKFVKAQKELVDWYVKLQLEDPVEAKKHQYKVGATMRARHKKYVAKLNAQPYVAGEVDYADVIDMDVLDLAADNGNMLLEMDREERRAVALGVILSGCGETLKSDSSGEASTADQLGDSGFGNLGSSRGRSGRCRFKSKTCPECDAKDVWTESWTEKGKVHVAGACGCKVVKQAPPAQASI